MLEFKPDSDVAFKRTEAWWNGETLDYPLTHITFPKPQKDRVPGPTSHHASLRDRWMDTEYAAQCAYAQCANTVWVADAIPFAFPNLGPDVFAAFYGCELDFGEVTSWSK